MHAGYYPRVVGPSVVLVRFRCSRCRKRGERYVKQEEWEGGIFRDPTTEASLTEQSRFASLGPIGLSELVRFHQELESADLSELTREFDG
jgi:hypothetical protein